MKNRSLTVIAVLFLSLASLWSQDYKSKASVSFVGDARVHEFKGHAESAAAALSLNDQKQLNGKMSLSIADISTDKDARDTEMQHMFESKVFPLITANFGNAKLDESVPFAFRLEIHGVSQKVEGTLSELKVSDKELGFQVKFPVSLEAFKLVAPSFMFGVIKVKDKVDVTVVVTTIKE